MVMPFCMRSPDSNDQPQRQGDSYIRLCSSCWGCAKALLSVLRPLDRGGNYKAIAEAVRSASAEARLYVLIHNIDGPGDQPITLSTA